MQNMRVLYQIWLCEIYEDILLMCPNIPQCGYMEHGLNVMTSSNGNIFRVTGPLCGEFTGHGEFPAQRPVTRSFDVFFDLRLNKRLSKNSWGWWFEMPSRSLWRYCNDVIAFYGQKHTAHRIVCHKFPPVRDKPPGAPAFVKLVYY